MHLHFIVFIIVSVQAKIRKKFCEVYSEDSTDQCFVKESLLTMVHSPHQLAVDRESNTLYFSFDSGQGEYIPALLKLSNKELTVLKGVKDAFAIAYDSLNKEMYFGGTHGIYKYNTHLKSLKRLNIKNLDIWWVFVKNEVYFIKFPSLNPYSFQNGKGITFNQGLTENAIHHLVIDSDNNKMFTNNSGLYGIKPNEDKAILIKDSPRFINMATDNDGHVYACAEDGIYVITKMILKVKRLVKIHGVLGLTFDKDNNIIYSDSHEIVRLVTLSKELT